MTDYYDFTLTNYILRKKDEEYTDETTKRGIVHEALFPDSKSRPNKKIAH